MKIIMSKIILLFVLIVLPLSLTACGGGSGTTADSVDVPLESGDGDVDDGGDGDGGDEMVIELTAKLAGDIASDFFSTGIKGFFSGLGIDVSSIEASVSKAVNPFEIPEMSLLSKFCEFNSDYSCAVALGPPAMVMIERNQIVELSIEIDEVTHSFSIHTDRFELYVDDSGQLTYKYYIGGNGTLAGVALPVFAEIHGAFTADQISLTATYSMDDLYGVVGTQLACRLLGGAMECGADIDLSPDECETLACNYFIDERGFHMMLPGERHDYCSGNGWDFCDGLCCVGALSENCINGVDDDGDELVDCFDPTCFVHPECSGCGTIACDAEGWVVWEGPQIDCYDFGYGTVEGASACVAACCPPERCFGLTSCTVAEIETGLTGDDACQAAGWGTCDTTWNCCEPPIPPPPL